MSVSESKEIGETAEAGAVSHEHFDMKRWQKAIIALIFAQLLSACAFGFSAPLTPLYVQYLGVQGEDQIALWSGLLTSSAGWTLALTSPLWGAIADRYGRKMMVLRAAFGGMLIVGAMGFVTSVEQLLVLRFLQGMTTGVVVAITALVASITPKQRLGRSLGLLQTALFTGNSLGPFIGGYLADAFGYRLPFYMTGVVLGLSGLTVLFFVQEPARKVITPTATIVAPKSTGWWRTFAESTRAIATPAMLAMIAILAMVSLSQSIISPILPLVIQFMESDSGRVATDSGLILGVTGFTSAIAAVWLGRYSEKWGYQRVLIGCAIGAAIVYIPQTFAASTWQMLALRGLLGFFLGGLGPVSQAVIAEISPADKRGTAYGLSSSANSIGFAVGPLLGAGIAVFNYHAVFLTTAILLFIVGIWVARLRMTGETTAES